ncbi:MAG: dihydroorotase family protein [Nitrososphaeria archaeon]|nr:dihydroorotase family protein [Nitrososphaeria archaeon]
MTRGKPPSNVDLVVEGKVFLGESLEWACVAIEGDEVVGITSPSHAPSSEQKITYGDGHIILPGMVDIHVHMREPGLSYKEDWETGSKAALRGGVTVVCDMPNNVPPIKSRESLMRKIEIAEGKSLVDFGLYIGYTGELEKCSDLCVGVKLYPEDLAEPGLIDFLREAARLGKLVVIHPEDPELIRGGGANYCEARPPESEISAVRKLLELGSGARLHFTHVSTSGAIMEILAKKAQLREFISFDVTPHHMLLNSNLYSTELFKIAKVNPPLRSEDDRRTVYGVVRGMLADAVVTDHAPHSLGEKLSEDFSEVPPGFPALEIALHLLLREILEGRLGLKTLNLYSSRPAEILGIRRGRISMGYKADLVIVKIGVERVVRGEDFVSKAKYTPFEGWRLATETRAVYLRGRKMLEDGEYLAERGGELICCRSS